MSWGLTPRYVSTWAEMGCSTCHCPACPGTPQAGCSRCGASCSPPEWLWGQLKCAASASLQIQSLHYYCICLMPLWGACLLAYRFWSSAKWHFESVQLSHKSTLRSWAPSGAQWAIVLLNFTRLSPAAVWAVNFCCRVQTWPQALYLCWLTLVAISIHAQFPSSNSFDIFWPE